MKWIALFSALLASAAFAGLPAPQFKVELKKAEDAAAITTAANNAIVTITSKSGIGGAKLIRTGEAWPARISIRLGITNLEGFELRNGIIHCNTFLKSPQPTPYWKVGHQERADPPDGNLEIHMTKTASAIEIVVPKEMLDGNPKEISCGWIDAYRN